MAPRVRPEACRASPGDASTRSGHMSVQGEAVAVLLAY